MASPPPPRHSDALSTEASVSQESFLNPSSITLESASTCFRCKKELGKRKMNPRHHCRICNKSVCGNCSPNQVQLACEQGLQRVCTQCVAIVERSPALLSRSLQLLEKIHSLGSKPHDSDTTGRPLDLEETTSELEAALVDVTSRR